MQILFFNNPNYYFFVITKVCWTVCVFHFLNLESWKRIYASLLTFRDFRHRCTMILKVERTLKHVKTTERKFFFFFFLIFIFNCKVLTYNTYLQTMYDTYATNRTILYYTERKLLYNVWMHFSPTLCQKYMYEHQCSKKWSIASVIRRIGVCLG